MPFCSPSSLSFRWLIGEVMFPMSAFLSSGSSISTTYPSNLRKVACDVQLANVCIYNIHLLLQFLNRLIPLLVWALHALLMQRWASEVSIGLLVVAFATNVLYTGLTRVYHHLVLTASSCVLLLLSFCAMASCQFTVFNVLLLLLLLTMCCSGQQCSPANNSQGMIIPTADLPSKGTPHVYTCIYN